MRTIDGDGALPDAEGSRACAPMAQQSTAHDARPRSRTFITSSLSNAARVRRHSLQWQEGPPALRAFTELSSDGRSFVTDPETARDD
ncbi:MAG: hypothetical protein HOO96_11760 [Polyangiaceae bacterium]|nr:hypothetical protein [Polyangiaceae bacterium]